MVFLKMIIIKTLEIYKKLNCKNIKEHLDIFKIRYLFTS